MSRQVGDFERWLGVSLFQRTTRRVSLTPAGEFLIERLSNLEGDVRALREDAEALSERPRGRLRITAPHFYASRKLVPRLSGFLRRYPDVRIELELSDRHSDIVSEGIDLAIRIGQLADSSLVARRLGEVSIRLVASPSLVQAHGQPANLDEVLDLPCLLDTSPGYGSHWMIGGRSVRLSPVVAANNGAVIRDLALAGTGVALLPDFFVEDSLGSGELLELLPGLEHTTIPVHAVYPPRTQISLSARVFTDWLQSSEAR